MSRWSNLADPANHEQLRQEYLRLLTAYETDTDAAYQDGYQRGREDEKAVWMNPCWQCGMNADSAYICDDCIADSGGGEGNE